MASIVITLSDQFLLSARSRICLLRVLVGLNNAPVDYHSIPFKLPIASCIPYRSVTNFFLFFVLSLYLLILENTRFSIGLINIHLTSGCGFPLQRSSNITELKITLVIKSLKDIGSDSNDSFIKNDVIKQSSN